LEAIETLDDPIPLAAVQQSRRGKNGCEGHNPRGHGNYSGSGNDNRSSAGSLCMAACRSLRQPLLGPLLGCVMPTGRLTTTVSVVRARAVGETECPGMVERCRPRNPGPCHRPDIRKGVFLVDTGAAFSIDPHQSSDTPNGSLVRGPSTKNIPCWGEHRLCLCLNGCHSNGLLSAAVEFPILGNDFLQEFQLLVDPTAGTFLLNGPHRAATAVGWSSFFSSTAAAATVKELPGSAVAVSQVATCGPASFQQLLDSAYPRR
jgi:hypothetical protein